MDRGTHLGRFARSERARTTDSDEQDEIEPDNSPFECPLTLEVMSDPVTAADDQTYERKAIQDWFDRGKKTSPNTNVVLKDLNLVPNIEMREAIEAANRRPGHQSKNEALVGDKENIHQQEHVGRARCRKEGTGGIGEINPTPFPIGALEKPFCCTCRRFLEGSTVLVCTSVDHHVTSGQQEAKNVTTDFEKASSAIAELKVRLEQQANIAKQVLDELDAHHKDMLNQLNKVFEAKRHTVSKQLEAGYQKSLEKLESYQQQLDKDKDEESTRAASLSELVTTSGDASSLLQSFAESLEAVRNTRRARGGRGADAHAFANARFKVIRCGDDKVSQDLQALNVI